MIIYGHALISTERIRPGTNCGNLQELQSQQQRFRKHRTRPYRYTEGADSLAPRLLQVCQLIYNEAAVMFYGKNKFHFVIGLSKFERQHRRRARQSRKKFNFIEDNLTKIPREYLKMVTDITVDIGRPERNAGGFPDDVVIYRRYEARLDAFAALFNGCHHALKRIIIEVDWWFHGFPSGPSVSSRHSRNSINWFQYVLEPLGMIHNINHDAGDRRTSEIQIRGVTPALSMRMQTAMRSHQALFEAVSFEWRVCKAKASIYGGQDYYKYAPGNYNRSKYALLEESH